MHLFFLPIANPGGGVCVSGHLGLDLGHAHLGHAKATGRARRLHDVDGELDFADEAVQLLALEGASLLDSNEA